MTIARKFARLRRKIGIDQYRLAAAAGMHQSTISLFENGLRKLSAAQIAQLERVLRDEARRKVEEAEHCAQNVAQLFEEGVAV